MNTILLCFLTIFMTEYRYNSLHYYLLNFLTIYISIPSLLLKLYCTMSNFFFLETFLVLYSNNILDLPIHMSDFSHGSNPWNINLFLFYPRLQPLHLPSTVQLFFTNTSERQETLKLHLFISFSFFFELEFSLHRPGWSGT